ncbi:CRISPR-associated endonuclease Cas3'' [Actinomyces ruminis]|uniref:CRISPR-associated endonuclease Cas3'' n=1 Tax=Actinomyces ruminis TaxID=1937003 RepID=UPI00211E07C4|nr:CRISPR-associated endonuclease Cas3'' [Actinomyces ruminis]
MTLSAPTRSVWAKSGYDPDSRVWLPLWLHLLDSAAVAEHLARIWLAPTVQDLIEREFAGSNSDLSPVDEFCLLASWIAGVHDIGKCSPAFSSKVPHLDDRMREAGLKHEPLDTDDRRKMPHGLAGHIVLQRWLRTECAGTRGGCTALASVVGAHHAFHPPRPTSPLKPQDVTIC